MFGLEALEEQIREARRGGMSVRKAAAKFGVSPGTVQRIPFVDYAGASAAAGSSTEALVTSVKGLADRTWPRGTALRRKRSAL